MERTGTGRICTCLEVRVSQKEEPEEEGDEGEENDERGERERERDGESEWAGGQQYCKLSMKYSIFNQTPSIP